MKMVDYYWEHPELRPHLKNIPLGEFLFRQGDSGNTMFIIIRGIVQLVGRRDGKEHVISWLEAGDFLGEKAILKEVPHQRAFSARAKTELQVLELGLKDLDRIEKNSPTLMNDILKRSFQVAAARLDAANQMVQVLRPSNNVERLVRLILHFCRTSGREVAEGWEVPLTIERFRYYIDMTDYEIDECFNQLAKAQLIYPISDNYFLVPDQQRLLAQVPLLKEQLPSLTPI